MTDRQTRALPEDVRIEEGGYQPSVSPPPVPPAPSVPTGHINPIVPRPAPKADSREHD